MRHKGKLLGRERKTRGSDWLLIPQPAERPVVIARAVADTVATRIKGQ